ncbi:MAG: UvrD-helicase domain-containing protein [Solirubrobacteraceae bacterium]
MPRALLAAWVRLSGHLPRARRRAPAGIGMSAVAVAPGPTFTPEQRAAIEDRSGSSLLAANAGSGKTAVMVERFVEAVLDDGLEVGAILALTFTEKAAGELRERVRRRFTQLGEHEHARTAQGAAIGTIHGFCAGVLRAHPFAAGLDPRFTVLQEPVARRLHDGAYDRALEAWAAAEGPRAVDVVAAGRDDLRAMVLTAYAELRSGGVRSPRLPVPPSLPAPDPAALRAALAGATARLQAGNGGKKVDAARAALEFASVLPADHVPLPTDLDAAKLPTGAKLLQDDACAAYRDAWAVYRQACADHYARPVVVLVDRLLDRFAAEAARAKAARAAVDFEDLQLLTRDLFADDAAIRARWSERYALIMVDEFQDTNRLQLDVLEQLERDNLFVVGDEFQSIYGFRHADVEIFRRRMSSPPARARRLTANFRSRPELLETLNAAFAPIFGARFEPLVAGLPATAPAPVDRLFDPDHVGTTAAPPVELLLTDSKADWDAVTGLGLEIPGEKAWRRAEARLVAQRLREELDGGRRPGEVTVLVRAAASLRALEHALEEQGVPTYVVGGRGYWSQEQVRDGLAYLSVLVNPLDEHALYALLASPFGGATAEALVRVARAGAVQGGAWAALRAGAEPTLQPLVDLVGAERPRAQRLAAEVLLERAIAATGYDVAVLSRPGGERRLANLRKLMRLAREYERSEGRDLRAFVDFAVTQDLSGAREGEAALESEGLDAVRLMTIHRAKGLEFPVVCVADLGRQGPGGGPSLLLGGERIGIRLKTLGAAAGTPALDFLALNEERLRREDEEERRLFYVAMTRAQETLILSGGMALERGVGGVDSRPGGAPVAWIARALAGVVEPRINDPARLRPLAAAPARPAGTALGVPATLLAVAAPAPVAPAAPTRLSFSSLGDYGRCAYRWYLRRTLGLPPVKPPPAVDPAPPRIDLRTRGSLVHELLEDFDFSAPQAPSADAIDAVAAAADTELTDAERTDVAGLVEAFARSPLCARLAQAASVRREAPFAFSLDPGGGGLLVNGIVDVLATEADGAILIVDYKTNPLDQASAGDEPAGRGRTTPAALTEADYATQRLVYALAALRAGAPRVEVAHCYLERPDEPATATYAAADAPALADALVQTAGGLLQGDFAPTDTPHRDLCGSCPGRRALCSHPETRTLAPLN